MVRLHCLLSILVYLMTTVIALALTRPRCQHLKWRWLSVLPIANLLIVYRESERKRWLLWIFAPYGYFAAILFLRLMLQGD